MTLKGLVTGVAAAAVVGGAAAGVTCIALPELSPATAVQPVVWSVPLPQTPAPELQEPLSQTIGALGAGWSFADTSVYIERLSRTERIGAEAKYNSLVKEGYFPLATSVDPDVDQNGPVATANVKATTATGQRSSMRLTFVEGPSPTGWLLSKQSLLDLASAVG